VAAIADHGHVHAVDIDGHDPADHAHDVAQHIAAPELPAMDWAGVWAPPVFASARPGAPGKHERPPRLPATT
jgi:hypothetical protein